MCMHMSVCVYTLYTHMYINTYRNIHITFCSRWPLHALVADTKNYLFQSKFKSRYLRERCSKGNKPTDRIVIYYVSPTTAHHQSTESDEESQKQKVT